PRIHRPLSPPPTRRSSDLHLQALYVADAVTRVENQYARAGHIGEALKGRFAGVAAGSDENAHAERHSLLSERSGEQAGQHLQRQDRKSTRLNSSHLSISYA